MFDAYGQVATNIIKSVHVKDAYRNHVSDFNATFNVKIDGWFRTERVIFGIPREINPTA